MNVKSDDEISIGKRTYLIPFDLNSSGLYNLYSGGLRSITNPRCWDRLARLEIKTAGVKIELEGDLNGIRLVFPTALPKEGHWLQFGGTWFILFVMIFAENRPHPSQKMRILNKT